MSAPAQTISSPRLHIQGEMLPDYAQILTPDAVALVSELVERFAPQRNELLTEHADLRRRLAELTASDHEARARAQVLDAADRAEPARHRRAYRSFSAPAPSPAPPSPPPPSFTTSACGPVDL